MRDTVIVIGYETSYLEEKIKSLGYRVYPINYYKNKNIQQLSLIKLRQINRELRKKSNRISFIYASGLENKSNLYNFLEKNFHNMGNNLNFLYRCGFVYNFKKEITKAGMEVPKIVKKINHNHKNRYIYKPKNSCGGYDISFSRPKTDHYIQEFIPGTTYSINFFVCDQKFTFLGFNKQYHLKKFDKHPFVHAGACNIRNIHYSRTIKKSIEKLSEEMNLKGFNSIDFKVYKKNIYLLDINPRITSTFKIYNDFYNNDLLKCQLSTDVKHNPKYKPINKNYGFVHIFSKENLIFKNIQLLSSEIMNVPKSGEVIHDGSPIFTIFTSDINYQKLREKLRKKITMTKDIYNCYDIGI